MPPTWAKDAFFYHIYPLGLCGAPRRNDFQSPPVARLEELYPWLDAIQNLGADALYLGPLFESSAHGYDTADYFQIDRRLGTRATLAGLAREIHRRGMRLVLDGVFNHVGRDFWAFRDLRANLGASAYADWFEGLDFSRRSPYGDPFGYQGWSGHYDLVKLNLAHPEVRAHLFEAVRGWVEEYEIDGLRLDAADQLSEDFLAALASHCRGLRDDIWLMGEIVHGDYRRLAGLGRLDSTTNYECYKGLYSSLNDRNYFEIAYALNRQFGPQGIYRELDLYTFVDNHDVDRAASILKDPAQLFPLYCLLMSMPGIPSIYYGSEWGLEGRRSPHSDLALRPRLDLPVQGPHPDLARDIARLAEVRRACPALRRGSYRPLHVAPLQFAFLREDPQGGALVAINAAPGPVSLELDVPLEDGLLEDGLLLDRLNPGDLFQVHGGRLCIPALPPRWARILTPG